MVGLSDDPTSSDNSELSSADPRMTLAEREAKVLELERSLEDRERSYAGRRSELADKARDLSTNASAVRERALSLGERGVGVAKMAMDQPIEATEESKSLETASSHRLASLDARRHAILAREAAVSARADALEQDLEDLEYRQELHRIRNRDLQRLEDLLANLQEPAEEPSSEEAPGPTENLPAMTLPSGMLGTPVPDNAPVDDGDDERRIERRSGLKVYVGLESDNHFYPGFSRNISAGGIFIASRDLLDIGQEVEVLFQLPSGDIVHTTGQVAWLQDPEPGTSGGFPGMGVRFTSLTPEDEIKIELFLEEMEEQA